MTKLKLPRDFNVLSMIGRKSGAFKDKRLGRQGSKNSEQEYLEEYEDSQEENTEWEEKNLLKSKI